MLSQDFQNEMAGIRREIYFGVGVGRLGNLSPPTHKIVATTFPQNNEEKYHKAICSIVFSSYFCCHRTSFSEPEPPHFARLRLRLRLRTKCFGGSGSGYASEQNVPAPAAPAPAPAPHPCSVAMSINRLSYSLL